MEKQVKYYCNDNVKSLDVLNKLKNILKQKGVTESKEADNCIAIGGDGAFLRMIKAEQFNAAKNYVGINTGTLGFLQTITPDEINVFADAFLNDKLKKTNLSFLKCIIEFKNGKKEFCCLNEITVRDKNYYTAKLDILVDGSRLESMAGDGVLICSSVGSTAYNLSFGGSIIPHNLATMQITSIAPLNNKVFRTLTNSVVLLDNSIIEIVPLENKDDLIIHRDGEKFEFNDTRKITVKIAKEKLTCLNLETHSFYERVNEKLLGEING